MGESFDLMAIRAIEKERDELEGQVSELLAAGNYFKEGRDRAYKERNALACLLTKLYPAQLLRHEDSDTSWENDWRNIVCILLPTGQVTWHIHDSEMPLFKHLTGVIGVDGCTKWDGHTTEEKYARIAAVPDGDKIGEGCNVDGYCYQCDDRMYEGQPEFLGGENVCCSIKCAEAYENAR